MIVMLDGGSSSLSDNYDLQTNAGEGGGLKWGKQKGKQKRGRKKLWQWL